MLIKRAIVVAIERDTIMFHVHVLDALFCVGMRLMIMWKEIYTFFSGIPTV